MTLVDYDHLYNVFAVVKGKIIYETKTAETLKQIQKLGAMAKQIMADRLNDLMAETDMALAVTKDQGYMTTNELNNLKGKYLCLLYLSFILPPVCVCWSLIPQIL